MAGKKKLSAAEKKAKKEEAERYQNYVRHLRTHWAPTESTPASLKKLEDGGMLPKSELGVWRPPPAGESFPQPLDDEIVVFEDYFVRGLGIPVHNLLVDACLDRGISLCHLHPNSIMTVTIFAAYCEMYLAIPPLCLVPPFLLFEEERGRFRGFPNCWQLLHCAAGWDEGGVVDSRPLDQC